MSNSYKLLVLPGDGIGPEVMKEVIKVAKSIGELSNVKFEIEEDDIGGCLAHQDTGEQVIRELGMTNMKLLSPVVHGNTIYAYTEVLETESIDDKSGKVVFRHYGVDQDDNVVFQGDRSALLRKQP